MIVVQRFLKCLFCRAVGRLAHKQQEAGGEKTLGPFKRGYIGKPVTVVVIRADKGDILLLFYELAGSASTPL